MKRFRKILLLSLILAGLGLGLGGCVGYVEGGAGYYHGYHGGWYHEGPWMYGPRGYGGIHPMRRW